MLSSVSGLCLKGAILLSVVLSSVAEPSDESSQNDIPLVARQAADSASYTSDLVFKSQMLLTHNFFRAQHGALPVVWNDKVAKTAATAAAPCVFKHSGTKGVGENIAIGFSSVLNVMNAWGLERVDFNFNNPGFVSGTGHFSAIVWKGTTSIGCARKKCSDRKFFVVCQYAPVGNIVSGDAFKQNVGRIVTGKLEVGLAGKKPGELAPPEVSLGGAVSPPPAETFPPPTPTTISTTIFPTPPVSTKLPISPPSKSSKSSSRRPSSSKIVSSSSSTRSLGGVFTESQNIPSISLPSIQITYSPTQTRPRAEDATSQPLKQGLGSAATNLEHNKLMVVTGIVGTFIIAVMGLLL